MSLAPSMIPSPGYADTAEELRPNGAAIRKADIKTTVFVGNIDTTSCSRLNARKAEPLPNTPNFMQTACQLIKKPLTGYGAISVSAFNYRLLQNK